MKQTSTRFIVLLLLLLLIGISTKNIQAQTGTTWTARTASTTGVWTCVAYGNGTFVALGTNSSSIMTSTDGITWTTRTVPAANFWRSVTYGNNLFVAVSANGDASNRIITSPDGINWTLRAAPAADMGWSSVTYGNNTFVAVAGLLGTGTGSKVMTSTDGINWTSRTASANSDWTGVTYGNNLFVAVANNSTTSAVMTSPDGITWTGRTASIAVNWSSVTYGNNTFVAVANGSKASGPRIMSSTDGNTWTSRGANTSSLWNSVTFGGNLFVAVASSGTSRVYTSPDGTTWTLRTAAEANEWKAVTYGNGMFVAVAGTGTNRVMTSGCAAVTPSVSIAVAPNDTIAQGVSVTFTATPTNGGTTPAYQWKKNATDVGTNSTTYTDATLADGDVITCVLTSNDACASPTTGTSSGITMAVSKIYTWTGNTSSDWSTATNWTPNGTPRSFDNTEFPANPTNQPALPSSQTVANLTLSGSTKITLGDNDLTVTNNITGGSETAFVVTDGAGSINVDVTANEVKTIPVGVSTTSYDPVTVQPTSATRFKVKVKAKTSANDFTHPIRDFAKVAPRQWDITPTTAPGSTVVSLKNGGTTYRPTKARIGHYKASLSKWEELAATRLDDTWTATTADFSPFGVGEEGGFDPDIVLSTELVSFVAKSSLSGNLLTWTTANEVNNKGFEIERLNGNDWQNIGFKTANNKASSYQFIDNTPLSISTYRLRQIDNDGKETLSKAISIVANGDGKLKAYPNPVSNTLTIETGDANAHYQIINLLGQTILRGQTPSAGARTLDVSALSKGSYVLKVGAEQVKFVKQ